MDKWYIDLGDDGESVLVSDAPQEHLGVAFVVIRSDQIKTFIGDVTHELSTPITALSMATERALKKEASVISRPVPNSYTTSIVL